MSFAYCHWQSLKKDSKPVYPILFGLRTLCGAGSHDFSSNSVFHCGNSDHTKHFERSRGVGSCPGAGLQRQGAAYGSGGGDGGSVLGGSDYKDFFGIKGKVDDARGSSTFLILINILVAKGSAE